MGAHGHGRHGREYEPQQAPPRLGAAGILAAQDQVEQRERGRLGPDTAGEAGHVPADEQAGERRDHRDRGAQEPDPGGAPDAEDQGPLGLPGGLRRGGAAVHGADPVGLRRHLPHDLRPHRAAAAGLHAAGAPVPRGHAVVLPDLLEHGHRLHLPHGRLRQLGARPPATSDRMVLCDLVVAVRRVGSRAHVVGLRARLRLQLHALLHLQVHQDVAIPEAAAAPPN
mmetsp:Transcript_49671/g.153604  ORF Transcript_49671/g.153604 Transcript_49671/m.153604 type:complete len:225 (+) Transcript_49671:2407-3081(+)